jgi:hypothetical protein
LRGDFNYRVLRFVFRSLALADFNFRLVRRVCMYEASVSAAIDMILFGEVVLVNESLSHARNADKNALWISFFSFALCQWPIPKIAFQLGSFPGTVSLIVIRAWSRWRGASKRRRALRARPADEVLSAAMAQLGVGGERSHFAPPLFFGADFRK